MLIVKMKQSNLQTSTSVLCPRPIPLYWDSARRNSGCGRKYEIGTKLQIRDDQNCKSRMAAKKKRRLAAIMQMPRYM